MHIHTEITIEVPTETVWATPTDIDAYEDWNPYHVKVQSDGTLAAGRRLRVEIAKPNGEIVTIKPRVLRMVTGRELTWGGGIKWVFQGEHRFILETTDTGTRLIHSEDFEGFAVRYASLDSIEEGYELMNSALKRYLEAGAPVTPSSRHARDRR